MLDPLAGPDFIVHLMGLGELGVATGVRGRAWPFVLGRLRRQQPGQRAEQEALAHRRDTAHFRPHPENAEDSPADAGKKIKKIKRCSPCSSRGPQFAPRAHYRLALIYCSELRQILCASDNSRSEKCQGRGVARCAQERGRNVRLSAASNSSSGTPITARS